MNVGGVASFVDSTVLLSWDGSLLARFSRFCDSVTELAACQRAAKKKGWRSKFKEVSQLVKSEDSSNNPGDLFTSI